MQRLYEPAAYDTATWPDSHWRRTVPAAAPCPPLDGGRRVDAAIVGAGYAGLSCAIELATRHGMEVAVLEAAQPGWGASGRNGGFACLGGTKLSDAAIARRVGQAGLDEMRRFQLEAVAEVAANLDRHGIDADRGPDGEVLLAHTPAAFRRAVAEAAPGDTVLPPGALREAGLEGPGFHGAIISPEGFSLHPMKYVLGLARAAQAAGVRIFGDSPVTALAPARGGGWRLATPAGAVTAAQVLVATNGYGREDLPGWLGGRTLPVLSTILVTVPVPQAALDEQGWHSRQMCFDSRTLLHYFRLLPCGRFLFGMRGGHSAAPAALAAVQARARRHFDTLFPALAPLPTEATWSGLVCLTGSLAPFCGAVPGAPGLHAALGWHGNGVAPASLAGRLIAGQMAGGPNRAPALMQTPPRRFPLPGLRRTWLRLAYAGLALRDGPVRAGRCGQADARGRAARGDTVSG